MRARRKGTNNPYIEIDKIQLKDSDILFKAENMEFDVQPEDYHVKSESDKHWQEIRAKAAIAAMQSLIREKYDASNGYLFAPSIAVDAVEYADCLIKKLKESN